MSELALLGGQPAVTNPPRERWVQVNEDVKAAVMSLLDQGIVSIGGPTGVIGEIEAEFAGRGYGELKKALTELVIATLAPLQRRYREITADPGHIDGLLAASVARLRPIVDATMDTVRRAMGHR